MMLTQLSTVKARLGLLETDTTYDAQLTLVIRSVSVWFEHEANRELSRQVGTVYEFAADETELTLPCYPIESVTRLEYKSDEINGWVARPTVRYQVRRGCIVWLAEKLGSYLEQGRVVYTGGYVLPGETALPGQAALPQDLEQAAVEQVTYWFQNRERIGLARCWENAGTYRQFYGDLSLLPSVRKLLTKYRRWRL